MPPVHNVRQTRAKTCSGIGSMFLCCFCCLFVYLPVDDGKLYCAGGYDKGSLVPNRYASEVDTIRSPRFSNSVTCYRTP